MYFAVVGAEANVMQQVYHDLYACDKNENKSHFHQRCIPEGQLHRRTHGEKLEVRKEHKQLGWA